MSSEALTASPAALQEWKLTDAIVLGAVLVASEVIGVVVASKPQTLFPWPDSTYFQRSELSLLITLTVVLALGAAAVLAICKVRRIGDPLSSIGWNLNRHFGVSTLVGLGVAAAVSIAPKFLFGGVTRFSDGLQPTSILLFFTTSVLVQPFVEEFYFRGILFAAVSKNIGRVGAVAVTALLFGLFHVGGYRWILTFITVGIVLAVTRIRTQSVAACFAVHAAYNMGILIAAIVHTG